MLEEKSMSFFRLFSGLSEMEAEEILPLLSLFETSFFRGLQGETNIEGREDDVAAFLGAKVFYQYALCAAEETIKLPDFSFERKQTVERAKLLYLLFAKGVSDLVEDEAFLFEMI